MNLAAAQWPIGRLSDRTDRRRLLIRVFAAIAAIALFVVLAARWHGALVLLGVAAMGSAVRILYPIAVAHVNDFLTRDQRVSAAGGLLLVWGIGAWLGPQPAALFMDWFGNDGLFLYVMAIGALGAAFAWYRLRVQRRLSQPGRSLP